MMTITEEEQILENDDFDKYYLLRARCDMCHTKTWHFYWMHYYPHTYGSDGIAACIEHSFVDELEKLQMFKDGRLRANSLSISIDTEKHKVFYDYGR